MIRFTSSVVSLLLFDFSSLLSSSSLLLVLANNTLPDNILGRVLGDVDDDDDARRFPRERRGKARGEDDWNAELRCMHRASKRTDEAAPAGVHHFDCNMVVLAGWFRLV